LSFACAILGHWNFNSAWLWSVLLK
jgi:hypothetical protein